MSIFETDEPDVVVVRGFVLGLPKSDSRGPGGLELSCTEMHQTPVIFSSTPRIFFYIHWFYKGQIVGLFSCLAITFSYCQ